MLKYVTLETRTGGCNARRMVAKKGTPRILNGKRGRLDADGRQRSETGGNGAWFTGKFSSPNERQYLTGEHGSGR